MNELGTGVNGIQATVILDVRGLSCPMPLFETKKELCKLTSGQILQIDVTDPGSRNDLTGWCERSGHIYLGEKVRLESISFFIKKG
jgi:tRNA 2-thiouridine synthesizing protein A